MNMDNKRKILIDTDPGIDDGCAILCALADESLDVLGILCVAGNKSLPVVTPNALRLVDFENRDIPVCKGSECKLKEIGLNIVQENEGVEFHGADGMGGSGLDYTDRCLSDVKAWDFMLEKIKEYPDEIDLITLGPLTNVALAIQKDLETMKRLRSITIMGGSFERKGNTTDYAEYNIWFDAEAAEIVVNELADYVDTTFVGLDGTHSCVLSFDEVAFLGFEGGRRGELIQRILKLYMENYWFKDGILGAVIHDLFTVLCLTHPEVIEEEKMVRCQLQTDPEHYGQTKAVEGKPNVRAIMKINHRKLTRAWLKTIMSDKQELVDQVFPEA